MALKRSKYDILLDEDKVKKLRMVCNALEGKTGHDYSIEKDIPLSGFCYIGGFNLSNVCEVIDGN
ncbi:hypothetical protein LCGC14_2484050 [marine sediment metagenome]|uniref:Uncharacterized protein n=1 Tax=marine sediment metagenome TaxID=412755 RepID=A0A0F9BUG5_9ZZZZ